jgi:hypothetical protein
MVADPQYALDFERIAPADLPRARYVAWLAMWTRANPQATVEELEAKRRAIAAEVGYKVGE